MGLVQDLLSVKESFLFNKLREWRAKEQKLIADAYEMRNRFSVGDFTSLTCCPKKILENKAKAKRFNVNTTYKLDLGKEIHRSYQMAMVNTPNLTWVKPYNFPKDIMILSPDKDPISFGEKIKESWPEFPVCLLDSNGEIAVIGYPDGVINRYKKPVLVDFKSVNIDPIIYKNKFSEHYPDPKHELQVKCYIYICNLWEYYEPFKIEKGLLGYINPRMEVGDLDAEKEVEVIYTATDERLIGSMFAEAVIQIEALKSKQDVPCGYENCREHGKEEVDR